MFLIGGAGFASHVSICTYKPVMISIDSIITIQPVCLCTDIVTLQVILILTFELNLRYYMINMNLFLNRIFKPFEPFKTLFTIVIQFTPCDLLQAFCPALVIILLMQSEAFFLYLWFLFMK